MVDAKLKEWVDSERKKGASDELLRQGLLAKGYKHEDIDEALGIPGNLPLLRLIVLKGPKFALKYWWRISMSIMLLMSLVILPLINSFISASVYLFYCYIALVCFIAGILQSSLFNELFSDTKRYMRNGSLTSTVIAIIFGIAGMIIRILNRLSEMMESAKQIGGAGMGGLADMFNHNLINAHIGFAIAFIMFNIPFLRLYSEREDKNNGYLNYYLIPITLYIIAYFMFLFITNQIFSATMQ